MDFRDILDGDFLSSLADGSHFATPADLSPELQDLTLDPLAVDAPAPAAPEGDLVSPPAAAGVPEPMAAEAPIAEAPQPEAVRPASAPAPTGADALFNPNTTPDDRADSILGA